MTRRMWRLIDLLRGPARKFVRNLQLYWRWALHGSGKPMTDAEAPAHGLDRCRVIYINLDRRPDRNARMKAQFAAFRMSRVERFAAIARKQGALGCAESHLAVLSGWRAPAGELLMVCEDDCEFMITRVRLDEIIEEFATCASLDVLCLAFNAWNGVTISPNLLITSNTQTTSCYVVKPQARQRLVEAAERSVASFGVTPEGIPIDMSWKMEQQELFFALPRRRAARQYPSYSDIEGQVVNYGA